MAVRTNFKAVLDKLRKTIGEESVKPEHLKALGDEAVRLITVRTRLGYGVDTPGAERQKLKPLSDAYIEMRRKSRGKLSGMTAPARSNLTFTGQMLESLKVIAKRFSVSIEPSGQRDDGISNQDVAQSVTRFGRPFISLSRLEIKQLKRFYETMTGKLLRKRGLTR